MAANYPKPFVAPDLDLPSPGDRWEARFGGPTPWQQSISQWAQMGNPVTKRPFEGLGKFDITESLPFTGEVPLTRLAPAKRLPAPQPGIFETLGRGLPGLITQFIPNGDFQNVVGNIGGFIGSLPDGLVRVIPSMEFLSGDMSVEEVFNALPEDKEKREYEAFIAADQSNAMRYMSEYMDSRQTEVARAMGVSALDVGALQPSVDMAEQLRRLVFNGALSALGNRTARGFVGSVRDVDGTILNADPATLNPELKELRERFDNGSITKEELLDELSVGRYRWTNDDSMYGAAVSLVMDVVTDPLTWFTFGIGGAAKSVAKGALAAARNQVAGQVTRAGLRDAAIDAVRGMTPRATWERSVGGSDGINDALHQWAQTNRPDLVDAGMQGLSQWQRAQVAVAPIIKPAAAIANQIDTMFGFFGVGALGKHLGSTVVAARMQGFAAYYGAKRLKGLQDFYGESRFAQFQSHLGIAGSNVNLSLQQKNMARQAMAADPNWRGDKFTPDEVAAARMSADEHFPIEAQKETARTDESMLPAGQGEAAYKASIAGNIATLAPDLASMTGKTVAEATEFLQKQDRKGLALAHRMVYANTVKNMSEAKRNALTQLQTALQQATAAGDAALIKQLQDQIKAVQNYTLVSERALTFQRATDLLNTIRGSTDPARQAARAAIDQYDTLGHSYLDGKFTSEELRSRMVAHLEELLADPDNRLIRTLDPMNVHADVAKAMGGSKYEVGLAPLDRWGITKGKDSVINGVNTFVDAIDDAMPSDLVRPWGRRDIWKERFFGGIHGARLYYEAEAKFKELGVRQYHMSVAEAQRLFRGVHRAANEQGIGPRGLTPDDVIRIADEVELEDTMRARVGKGSLMELVLRAFEGDLATVGLAPRVTGRMKTASGRLGNWLGLISEKYYGALRFYLSPIFQMMEAVEGPFFMLLRGIKPGIRWTARDLRMMAILDHMRGTGERYTDQLERAQSATIDTDMSMRLSRAIDGHTAGGWRRLIPSNWHRVNPLEAGIRTQGVMDLKKLQYIRHEGRAASENWAAWMDKNNPDLLATWKAEMGTGSIEDLYMRAMEERGAFNDSNRHIIHMMDAVKPANLGKRERIRMGDVAKFHGYHKHAELVTDIRNGNLTRGAFIGRYTNLNVPLPMAERMWAIASGPTMDEWHAGVATAFEGNAIATTAFMDFHHWMARKAGMSFEEFMNTEYSTVPQLVQRSNQIPKAAFFRQTVEESLRQVGMNYYPKGHPKHTAALEEVKRLSPEKPAAGYKGKTKAVKDEQGKVTGGVDKYENIQLEKARVGREAVDADPDAVMPAQHVGKSDDDMYDQVTADTLNAFDNDMDEINTALDWYDEVLSIFAGIADALPEGTIRALMRRWETPSHHGFDAWRSDLWEGVKEGTPIGASDSLYRAMSDEEFKTGQKEGEFKTILGNPLYLTDDADRLAGGAYGGKGGGYIVEFEPVPTVKVSSQTVSGLEEIGAPDPIPKRAIRRVWKWDPETKDHVLVQGLPPLGRVTPTPAAGAVAAPWQDTALRARIAEAEEAIAEGERSGFPAHKDIHLALADMRRTLKEVEANANRVPEGAVDEFAGFGDEAAEFGDEAAQMADEEWDFYSEAMEAGTPNSVTLERGAVRSISGDPKRDRTLVSRDANGRPNGFLKLDVNPTTDEVGGMFVLVRKDARRQGIATRLYDEAEAQGFDVSKVSGLTTTELGGAFVADRRAKAQVAGLERATARVQQAEILRREATPTWRSSHDDLARKDQLTGLPDTAIEVSEGNWVYYDENGQAAAHAGVAYGRGVAFVSSREPRKGYATKLYDRILEVRGPQFLDALGGTKMTPEGKSFVSSWLRQQQDKVTPRVDPTTVELGSTPVPPGMIRLYHYTRAPEAVLEQGILRSKAIGESYGEPNVIWASAQKPEGGTHAGIIEFNVYPHELDTFGPPRTQADIDQMMANGSNVTLNLDKVEPNRFVAFNTPEVDGYQYMLREYGRTPTEATVQMVRDVLKIPGQAEREPRVAGYQRWLDEVEAGTLAPKVPEVPGEMGIEQARASLAARMQVAFSGSQQNNSVLNGMRQMLATIDRAAYGGPSPVGMGVVLTRINDLLTEYKNMPAEALGLKLWDFFDSLAGNTTRSVTSAIGEPNNLQPAAMDIHMRRAWGYGDSAFLNRSALTLLRSRGKALTPENIDAAEVEIAAARKWDLEETRARSNDAPDDAEYEWMLRATNALMHRWNRDKTIKRKVVDKEGKAVLDKDGNPTYAVRDDLTAAQVQAALWVAVKRQSEDIEVPPTMLLRQSGVQVAVETLPGEGTHLARWMPDYDSILEMDAAGDELHARDLMRTIEQDIHRQIVPIIQSEVGSLLLGVIDGNGRWVPPKGPSTHAPNATVEWAGSVAQNEKAARLHAYFHEQTSVYVLSQWSEKALATDRNKPVIRSDASTNRLWSQDLSLDPSVPKHVAQNYLEPLTKWYEQAMKRANIGSGQFPGSMAGTLDDGALAVRQTWNQSANPGMNKRWDDINRAIADAERVTPEEAAILAKSTSGGKKGELAGTTRTAEDKARLADIKAVRKSLLDAPHEEYGGRSLRKARDFYGTWDDEAKVFTSGTDKASLADMQEHVKLLPEDLARLEDGTWVKDIGEGYKPMPVRVSQNPVQARELAGDHRAELERLGVDVGALDGRHKETVRGIYLDSYGRHAPSATGVAFERQRVANPDAPYFQRDPATGNVRGAFAPAAAGHGASTYFVANTTDATSAIHESFHLFTRHLQPSSRDAFVRAYNDAHGLTGTRGAKRTLTVDVEEWMAAEFEAFAAGDYSRAGEFGATFKAYAEWAQQHGSARVKGGANPAAAAVFEQVLKDWGDVPSALYDLEQERMYEAGRIATLRGEDEAHTTSYYKHSRTFIERSLNHPYLGLYPISYMWGKVLPELTRFLVRRPFGLKAPLGGLIAANHVWTNVQMQLQVDEELREWVDGHPESIRLLAMMTPGTPWELPVNFPAYTRHFFERQAENTLRQERGMQPLGFDMGKAVSDTLGYAIGYSSLAERLGKIGNEVGGVMGDIGGGLAGLPGGALDSFTSESDAGY